MKKTFRLLFLLFGFFVVNKDNLFAMDDRNCSVYKGPEDFISTKGSRFFNDHTLKNVKRFLSKDGTAQFLLNPENRKESIDLFLYSLWLNEKYKEIQRIEEKYKLKVGIITSKARELLSKSKFKTDNFNKLRKKFNSSHDGVKLELGNSAAVFIFIKEGIVVKIQRTDFYSLGNGFTPYQWQLLTSKFTYSLYLNAKKKYDLTRFKIIETEVVLRDSYKGNIKNITDNDVLIATKYLENFKGIIEGRNIIKTFIVNAINRDKEAIKILRDLFIGVYKCGIKDLGSNDNLVLTYINRNLCIVCLDAEIIPTTDKDDNFGPLYKKNENGENRMMPPWRYPNEDRIHEYGLQGIGKIFQNVFYPKIALPSRLTLLVKKFLKEGELSEEVFFRVITKGKERTLELFQK